MIPLLAARLRAHGLPEGIPVILHANRRVLVSMTRRGALRVHRGYEAAPDEVVAAIARWARPRIRRADRRLAQRILVSFPVHAHAPPPPRRRRSPETVRPEHAVIAARLLLLHGELNTRHFGGTLGPADIRVSPRMRRRLGEFRPPSLPGERPEIALGLRHLRRDGWTRAAGTLLHEMVHQWQAETGRPLGHGREFREKCAEVGIEGRAIARLGIDFRSYLTGEV
ncbi:MAG TPA: SprT-like domain-containing protein [Gemmatimonadales bacterium]|nr:SprT-like domain-containing protein [Gemmatimonadales bacterium]